MTGVGGGVAVYGRDLRIEASTILGNTATKAIDAGATGFPFIEVIGSLVSVPSGQACGQGIVSLGYNLFPDTSCGTLLATDKVDANPRVNPLANYGGPTATYQLLTTSPARNTIPVGTPVLCQAGVSKDQRSIPRPQGPACDMGAFEGAVPPP